MISKIIDTLLDVLRLPDELLFFHLFFIATANSDRHLFCVTFQALDELQELEGLLACFISLLSD